MQKVDLDHSKLFGFKIVAKDAAEFDQQLRANAKISDKIGIKVGGKVGSKAGFKV